MIATAPLPTVTNTRVSLRHVPLPAQAAALIGREHELAQLVELAGSHRLITLTGPGGTGKTRLSLALASGIADRSADGVVWYSESGVTPNTLVRFDPKSETFSQEKIPSGGGVVRNMVATRDHRLYLACSGVNKVAVVDLK